MYELYINYITWTPALLPQNAVMQFIFQRLVLVPEFGNRSRNRKLRFSYSLHPGGLGQKEAKRFISH